MASSSSRRAAVGCTGTLLKYLVGQPPAGPTLRQYTVRAGELATPRSAVSLIDFIWAGIEANSGNGTAVHCLSSGRKIGYERLRRAAENLAGWLGQNCQGSLALLLPNSPESIVTGLGALEAGVPLSLLNPDASPEELARCLQQTRSQWLVTRSCLVHSALEAAKEVQRASKEDYQIKVISVDDEIVFTNVLQLLDILETPVNPATPRLGQSSSSSGWSSGSSPALLSPSWSEDGPRPCLTGSESLLASCLQTLSPHLRPGNRVLSNLPLFTRYGLSSVVLNSLSAGAQVVLLPPPQLSGGGGGAGCGGHPRQTTGPTEVSRSLTEHQPSLAYLSVSSLLGLHSLPSSLRSLFVPRPLDGYLFRLLSPAIADRVTQHYGPPDGPTVFSESSVRDPTRLGQPLPGTEVKVSVGGGEVGVMSEGEILVRGPQFDEPSLWRSTGDTGYYDPEGTFYLTQRGNLSVDGLPVWPLELENVLCQHEGISNAAVFSNGGSLEAAVVPTDPYHPPSTGELRLWLLSKTSPHKELSTVHYTSALPLTADGRIDRFLLAKYYFQPKQYAAVSSV